MGSMSKKTVSLGIVFGLLAQGLSAGAQVTTDAVPQALLALTVLSPAAQPELASKSKTFLPDFNAQSLAELQLAPGRAGKTVLAANASPRTSLAELAGESQKASSGGQPALKAIAELKLDIPDSASALFDGLRPFNKRYCVFLDNGFQKLTLRELARNVRPLKPRVWSARLGTGLLGLTNCPPGNKGPKSELEIMLAVGESGLLKLVEQGFIPCPSCRPEKIPRFWETVEQMVLKLYGIRALNAFIDKTVLPFDARRLNWENIVPLIGGYPSRLYIPKGLEPAELAQLKQRLQRLYPSLPAVGYYDPNSPRRFHEYQL